jgi:hypothetical protein
VINTERHQSLDYTNMNLAAAAGAAGAAGAGAGAGLPVGLGGLAGAKGSVNSQMLDMLKEKAADYFPQFLSLVLMIVLMLFPSTRPIVAYFIIAWSLFFGFFPYAFKCALHYKLTRMCFPRFVYTFAFSLVLWIIGLFVVNLDAGLLPGMFTTIYDD